MMVEMRRLVPLAAALAIGSTGCPGTERNLDTQPTQDAEPDPPDAALDVTAGEPVPVKVVNWNVQNLFNDVRDSPEIAAADEMILTAAEYQTKLADVSKVLESLSPDIAVLQEVENQPVIADLATALNDYPHLHITQGNDPRGIDIALLSRHPVERVVSHKQEFFQSSATGQTYVFARDVLEAHLIINGRHLVVLGIHLKSGTDAESQDKRLAEAERLREIVDQLQVEDQSSMIVVLGDFNGVPGSAPLTALMGAPPSALASVTADLPPADRYSVTFGGVPQLFDDQLVDADALALLDPGSVSIEHGPTVDAASDHDPVAATYRVK